MPDPISSSMSRPDSYYDLDGGACNAPPQDLDSQASKRADRSVGSNPSAGGGCEAKVAATAATCARAAITAMEAAPTLVGGLVASFLGGFTCGIAVMDAAECLSKSEPKPR